MVKINGSGAIHEANRTAIIYKTRIATHNRILQVESCAGGDYYQAILFDSLLFLVVP